MKYIAWIIFIISKLILVLGTLISRVDNNRFYALLSLNTIIIPIITLNWLKNFFICFLSKPEICELKFSLNKN